MGLGLIAAPANAATYTVKNTNDAGADSLRAAVAEATSTPADDTILFDSSVTGEIRLTSGAIEIPVDGNADTPASGNLEIIGPGEDVLSISGDANGNGEPDENDSRIFHAYGDEGEISLSGLTLTKGVAWAVEGEKYVTLGVDGGAVSAEVQKLTITDSTITDSVASRYGGGISQDGENFEFSGLTLTGNQAAAGGGAAQTRDSGSLTDSTVSGNAVVGEIADSKYYGAGRGGGLVVASPGTADGVLIDDVEISDNEVTPGNGLAGGLFARAYSGRPIVIENVTIAGNEAARAGGLAGYAESDLLDPESAVTLRSSEVVGNKAIDGAGGIHGTLRVVDSRVTGNHDEGGDAGGISSRRHLLIRTSTIANNTSANGAGGVRTTGFGSRLIDRSTISGNTGAAAGGVWADDYASEGLTVSNTTISGNLATGGAGPDPGGGGLYLKGRYGARIENSTITGNAAVEGAGGVLTYAGPEDPVYEYYPQDRKISSTIVAGNTVAGSPWDLATKNGGNPSLGFEIGFSLIGNPAGATIKETPAGTNLTGVDPQLGPLANNGGPTRTHMPAETSPAIDAGTANGLIVDQRGEPRRSDIPEIPNAADGTDIGSVEQFFIVDTEVEGGFVRGKKQQKQRGRKIKIKARFGADEAVTGRASGKVKVGKKSYPLAAVTRKAKAGKSAAVKLKPKKKQAAKKIARALKRRKKVRAKISVRLTDEAGNKVKLPLKVKLK